MANDFQHKIIEPFMKLQRFWNSDKPLRIVKKEGLNHFNASFVKGGFTDETFQKWPDRKVPKKLSVKNLEKWKKENSKRAILVGKASDTEGAHLKDSNTAKILGRGVEFSNDKVYAQVHNDGLLAGKAPGFDMPQRQFIGPSTVLEDKIMSKITKEINNILNTN